MEDRKRDIVTYPTGDLGAPHRDGIPINPGQPRDLGAEIEELRRKVEARTPPRTFAIMKDYA